MDADVVPQPEDLFEPRMWLSRAARATGGTGTERRVAHAERLCLAPHVTRHSVAEGRERFRGVEETE